MPGSPHRPLALPRVQWAGQRMVTPPNKDKAEKNHGAPHTSGKDSAQSERQALQHDARGHGVSFRTLGPVEAAKKKKADRPMGNQESRQQAIDAANEQVGVALDVRRDASGAVTLAGGGVW